ncbi:hypothetical protein [Acetobacter papayae]|uniref:hypothetical protein n=1 Tax=Acetobacter papayae TaxID=1076592 RepID=UPI0039EAC8D9
MPIGNEQHAVWLLVSTAGSGANYHVGYRSCFYGCVDFSADEGIPASPDELVFYETHKTFDPVAAYGDTRTQRGSEGKTTIGMSEVNIDANLVYGG